MSLAAVLLAWFDVHGRRTLPTYLENDPYAIWVGEVLLQQTQLGRGLAYRERFLAAFPDLATLAGACEEAVQAVCAGIGYYGRIRRLHQAARQLWGHGDLPGDFAGWLEVPGVGRTTAAAIAVQAHGERQVVLDGNVQRVLARLHAVEEPIDSTAGRNMLWRLAQSHLPQDRLRDYTQALMDFGATWCLPRSPRCSQCPCSGHCLARLRDAAQEYPLRRRKEPRKVQPMNLALVYNGDRQVWLVPRPVPGIWAGLWSLPECEALPRISGAGKPHWLMRHQLTHRLLDIQVYAWRHEEQGGLLPGLETDLAKGRWLDPARLEVGVPNPIARILKSFMEARDAHGALHQVEQGGRSPGSSAGGRGAGAADP